VVVDFVGDFAFPDFVFKACDRLFSVELMVSVARTSRSCKLKIFELSNFTEVVPFDVSLVRDRATVFVFVESAVVVARAPVFLILTFSFPLLRTGSMLIPESSCCNDETVETEQLEDAIASVMFLA
jgi:hypothetical protein